MKYVTILGSTGSIGLNALEVIRQLGKEKVRVSGLAVRSNIAALEKQIEEFLPDCVAVFDRQKAHALQKKFPHLTVLAGMEGVEALAALEQATIVLSAMSGTAGLQPTLAAIRAKKTLALANKESLVSAGELVMDLARRNGVRIIPVDSEHSAIFQCLQGEDAKQVKRLILTASGGPFRRYTPEQLRAATLSDALKHPTWNMGPKITVDSSTLMNKGLELIEAYWLFSVPLDSIDVVVHPQSIIHSMVEFCDGSIKAQMGEPSMRVPIQYAFTYPKRESNTIAAFDFTKNRSLEFFQPDVNKFRCLKLAVEAAKAGGSLPCYMNAANEVLVNHFLENKIRWKDIGEKLECLMERHQPYAIENIEDVLETELLANREAESAIAP